MPRPRFFAMLSSAGVAFSLLPAAGAARLRVYNTQFYILHTDVPPAVARQAAVRMNCMARVYYRRTNGWTTGQITSKLPFYLFRRAADYYAAGGMPGSAGVFDGTRLMAIAGRRITPWTWHVIQHEGFHQFVYYKMQANLPTWVNEGLAEYFGYAIFTGDNYVTGIINRGTLRAVKAEMRAGRFDSIHRIRMMSHGEWNSKLTGSHYNQAWSMVYFLAHADHNRYRAAFGRYLRMLSHGAGRNRAWNSCFGNDDKDFQARWKKYWMSMPRDPSRRLENKATVETLTSFLARWTLLRKYRKFKTFRQFRRYAGNHSLPATSAAIWLPRSLLLSALKAHHAEGEWTLLHPRTRRAEIKMADHAGDIYLGRFRLSGTRVARVHVQVTRGHRQTQ